ncbi:MAG: hypothetical protein SVT52_07315 [Planctomycetota bacterium]|nr:hypothetical protein [Planctomycetota bacterium]
MQIEYKPNFQDVLERYKALWAGGMNDRIIARLAVREGAVQRDAFMANVPVIPRMFEDYLDYWRTMARLEDDTLPVISPSFGTGIEGGFFGSKVKYESGTSWCEHIPNLIDHPEKIEYAPDNDSVGLMRRCVKYYRENNNGRALVGPPNVDCPCDILYMLRGSEIYLDLVDRAGDVDRLLEKIADGVKKFRDELWEMIPLQDGGTFNGWMNWWVPGRTTMVGDDLFCSCSVDVYRRFGFPIHQQMADANCGAWFHLHNLGLHLVPEIAKLKNLICLELSEDPNVEIRGLEMLKLVREQVRPELVVIVAVRPEEFTEALDSGLLPGNTIYNVCRENYGDIECWDVDYANRLMGKVRKYRTKAAV